MDTPRFSVIVPTYQRPRELAACLGALAAQSVEPASFEVVVVDDACRRAEVEPITAAAGPFACRLFSQAHRGAAAARNTGASEARGRLLAFTDDDCRPAPNWLAALDGALREEGETSLVGGSVENALGTDPFASATQTLVELVAREWNREPGRARLLTSNNLAVGATVFRSLGGFDTAFEGAGGEDRELCLRFLHAGQRAVYRPEAVVHHAHALTLGGFLRQHRAYGRGAALLRTRARAHGYGPLALEPASFYWKLLASSARASGRDRWRQSALLALSQIANAAGYLEVRARGA